MNTLNTSNKIMKLLGRNTCKTRTFALSVAVIICLCQAGIADQSNCAKDLEPVPVNEDLREGLIYKDGNAIMCTDGTCKKLSLENLKNAYPDSFSTEEDAVETTELRYNEYVKELPTACTSTKQDTSTRFISPTCPSFSSYFFWSDRDKCCPTWPRNCRTCKQQFTIQSLLAWCPGNGGVKMHHFKIPTHCSCQ